MKNYKVPLSVSRYSGIRKAVGVFPLIAGAAGVVAGKALSAAVVGAAAAAGAALGAKMVGDSRYIDFTNPNMRVLRFSEE